MSQEAHPGLATGYTYLARPLTDGERWAAQALSDLRRRGYRPRAWQRFLGDSLARAWATRRARPGLARLITGSLVPPQCTDPQRSPAR